MRLKSESGREFILREVSACDSEPLGKYFESLSAETRKRYGPHPFTKEFAVELCTRKHDSAIRYVLTLAENKRFVGYFILEFRMSEELFNRYREQGIDLSDGKNPLFAPSIADDYLNTARYDHYSRFDIMVLRRFNFKKINLTTFLDIQNIIDRDNIWAIMYLEDGTTEMSLQYKQMPVFGITIEF